MPTAGIPVSGLKHDSPRGQKGKLVISAPAVPVL